MRKKDRVKLENVVPVFVSDYYDQPLSGICRYGDQTLFFSIVEGSEEADPEYAVYRLPKEQTDYFRQEQSEFERLVGMQWSFSEETPGMCRGKFSSENNPEWQN